jgi:hypothetical protein
VRPSENKIIIFSFSTIIVVCSLFVCSEFRGKGFSKETWNKVARKSLKIIGEYL